MVKNPKKISTNLTKWLSKCEGSLLEGKEKNTTMVKMMMIVCGNKLTQDITR